MLLDSHPFIKNFDKVYVIVKENVFSTKMSASNRGINYRASWQRPLFATNVTTHNPGCTFYIINLHTLHFCYLHVKCVF